MPERNTFTMSNRVAVIVGAVMGVAISAAIAVVAIAPLDASHALLAAAIAAPYLSFAAHDGRPRVMVIEATVVTLFIVAAMALLDGPVVPIAALIALHAAWDVAHFGGKICHTVKWWPPWCAALDFAAAVTLLVANAVIN